MPDSGGCDQSRWIDDFEPVVGEADDLFLAKDLKSPADMNVSETQRVAEVALAQRQLKSFTLLGRKPAAKPDIDLEKQMCDAFPSASKTEVGKMVVRARFIGGDLSAQENSQAWIGLDEDVQLLARKSVHANHREAVGGVIHRGVRCRLKPKYGTRKRKIQDLAGAVIEKYREGNPAIENNKARGTAITLTIEI